MFSYIIAAGQSCSKMFEKNDLEMAIQQWLRRAKERGNAEEKKIEKQGRSSTN